ncbi:MAG TPA: isocitrate/isopropylmalate dehydrogenase family protein [Patescibacteria group bacterium]|nr:isocitrate/isopropylmalate dehydrogenase family protein [Patescibacteria group bacterium]
MTLIPGDGIGPEICRAAQEVLQAAGVAIDWDIVGMHEPGSAHVDRFLSEALASARRTRVTLKGPIGTPIGTGYRSLNVALRQGLDLYANVRPIRDLDGAPALFRGIDMVLIRENTEDLYSGVEHTVVPGVVVSLKIITEKASTRIARFGFEYVRSRGRKKIHAIHKANIMKLTDGMFLDCIRKVAAEYPEIEYREMIVDNAAMQLMMNPRQFDVLLLTNLYGDILSDEAAGLVGGLGVAASANLGGDAALFEAVHGSAPDIAGQGISNPTALLRSSVMMLDHLGEAKAAERVQAALVRVYREGRWLTRDIPGGRATTREFVAAVIDAFDKR